MRPLRNVDIRRKVQTKFNFVMSRGKRVSKTPIFVEKKMIHAETWEKHFFATSTGLAIRPSTKSSPRTSILKKKNKSRRFPPSSRRSLNYPA